MNIKIDAKKMKKIGISLAVILGVFYFVFLLILPNVINLNKYKSLIQKTVYENCKLNLDFQNIKLVTSPVLSVGVRLNGVKLSYPDKTDIFKTDMAEAKIALLPMIFKTITVDSVKVKSPEINLDILPDDRLKLEKYLTENVSLATQAKPTQKTTLDFKFKLNKLKITDYKLAFKDNRDSLYVKGKEIVLSKFELNKHARVVAKGSVYLNNKQNITYDIYLDTFLPDMSSQKPQEVQAPVTFTFNPVKAFKNYDLKLNASSKLKIRNKRGLDIKGFVDVENAKFSLPNQTLPESYMKLKFSGKKANIDSNIAVSSNEKATILGRIAYGKKHLIDLSVKTDKITMKSVQNLISGFLDSLAIKHDANKITPQGYMQADFKLKTDLKKVHSHGYFNVVDAAFIHKELPASIRNLNVDVDFSGNHIDIKKCQAYFNDALIEIKGKIDENANADINLNTKNLQVAKLYTAFAPKSMQKTITIGSGSLSLNAFIKGRLDKIEPELKLDMLDFTMKEKTSNLCASRKSVKVNLKADKKGYVGSIISVSSVASIPNLTINNPYMKVDFDDKKITLNKSAIFVNSSPITIEGEIKDYLSKCNIILNLNGNLKTSDIAKILPKEVRGAVAYKGQLPLDFSVKGTPKKMVLSGKITANSNNHFSPVTINKLLGKQSNISILIEATGSKLIIKDIGLYEGSNTIARVYGLISGIDKSVQKIDGLKVSLPKSLVVSTQMLKNSTMNVKGNMDITGTLLKPLVDGNFYITKISAPDLKTYIRRVALAFSGTNMNVKVEGANVYSSLFDIDLDSAIVPGSVFVISKMSLNSLNVDADKLLYVADKAARLMSGAPSSNAGHASSSSASANVPVKIVKGYAKISNFKMGDILASNISGNFDLNRNLLKIHNFSFNAYKGTISGSATYNLVSTFATARVNGTGLDANSVVTTFGKVKDQMSGAASFSANVTLRGADYTTQMKTLRGIADFEVKNGNFGSLGKLETFLKAPNLISQSFIRTSIGSVINTIAPYNSGEFKILKGHLAFSNGVANISSITSSGANMALLISGKFNLLSNNANLTILGRISSKLAGALGPLSQLTTDRIVQYLPAYGQQAWAIFAAITDKSSQETLNKIPELMPISSNTQEFKVVLNGDVAKPLTLVKSFKWLSTASEVASARASLLDILQATYSTSVSDVANSVVKSISQNAKVQQRVQNVQQNVQNRVQKIQQNETVQKVQKFGNFLKDVTQY